MIVSNDICLFRRGFYDKNFKETLLLQYHLLYTRSQYSSICKGWYRRSSKWLILTSLLHAVRTVSLLTLLERECGDEAFWAHEHFFFWARCNRCQHFIFPFLVRLYLSLALTQSFVSCIPECIRTPSAPLFTRFPPHSLSSFVLFYIRVRPTFLTRCWIFNLELASCH
jgi:hypothetical protein